MESHKNINLLSMGRYNYKTRKEILKKIYKFNFLSKDTLSHICTDSVIDTLIKNTLYSLDNNDIMFFNPVNYFKTLEDYYTDYENTDIISSMISNLKKDCIIWAYIESLWLNPTKIKSHKKLLENLNLSITNTYETHRKKCSSISCSYLGYLIGFPEPSISTSRGKGRKFLEDIFPLYYSLINTSKNSPFFSIEDNEQSKHLKNIRKANKKNDANLSNDIDYDKLNSIQALKFGANLPENNIATNDFNKIYYFLNNIFYTLKTTLNDIDDTTKSINFYLLERLFSQKFNCEISESISTYFSSKKDTDKLFTLLYNEYNFLPTILSQIMLNPFVFTRKSIITHLFIPLSGEPFKSPTDLNYRRLEILNNKTIEKQNLTAYVHNCTEYITYMTCQFIPLFFGVFYINLCNYADLEKIDILELLSKEIKNMKLEYNFTSTIDEADLPNTYIKIYKDILERTYNYYITTNLSSDGYYKIQKLLNLNPFDPYYYTSGIRDFIFNHYMPSQSSGSHSEYDNIIDQLYGIVYFLESHKHH